MKTTDQNNVAISKLGKTRAGERSRIWLEGKRLVAHGFTRGTRFYIEKRPSIDGWVLLTFERWMAANDNAEAIKAGTVAGTEERPIIDTVGALVRDTFGTKGTHVRCEFRQGVILIESITEGSK